MDRIVIYGHIRILQFSIFKKVKFLSKLVQIFRRLFVLGSLWLTRLLSISSEVK